MDIEFDGDVIEWRGPAPFVFAVVPPEVVDLVHELASELTYGWGVVPAGVTIGSVRWTTSLFPRDGGYLVPLRTAERRRAAVEVGDTVHLTLTFAAP
ncbi:DUF1905 domain-containing protein [Curtobacterium caseinilyticum]|uniref:DUF1905 domain-containing protein n=1 Tax=Curtobacterium caseinilyticum TaxID=3055137 RepID=A0ABT7TSC7_9MICO|nr:DUF1905 domain-containing protein [Curtobacterium caseinilyticum]MDM7892410.1 DUF1905 domain-containing protein [Curtobacterium caseinilyticum]